MNATPRIVQQPFHWPKETRAAVSLTFDDARLSQIDRGIPILDAHGVKATFYVSTARLEERLEEWRAAVANEHEIGNHTLTHPCSGNFPFARTNALEDYTLERMEGELSGASDAITLLIGVAPTTFAYPCGQTFVGRGSGVASYVPLVSERFLVGRGSYSERHNDPASCDLAQVFAMEADGKSFEQLRGLVARAVANGGWLVLFGHEIGEGGHQTTLPKALDSLCNYAVDPANEIWIDTVAAIGSHIERTRRLHAPPSED